MGSGHHHGDGHDHGHEHPELSEEGRAVLNLDVPDSELSPHQLARRGFLQRAGLLGAGAAVASVLPAESSASAAAPRQVRQAPRGGYAWLAGDHHIHTQFSSDAQYRVADQVGHAQAYGLDWLVITDHGNVTHAKIGVEKVNPDIRAAREEYDGMLVFQGLEWNIPAAEHGTVFVHPGAQEVAVLKEFESSFDGSVNGWGASSATNEQHALDGLDFLAGVVRSGRVRDAAFLANHPARKGIDSPHEIRGWRDRQPRIALGMEGAPGHQAAGIPKPFGPGAGRGFYDGGPSPDSFPAYPPESYVTWGGFDWMTATVGGLWDSLLAEGKPWWITANSDAHQIYLDDSRRPPGADTSAYFTANGQYGDPVHGSSGGSTTWGDFWPGYYSRTHIGAVRPDYAGVIGGLRAGRVWVDHGRLLDGLDVRVRQAGSRGPGFPLGSVVTADRGDRYELVVMVETASRPNWAQEMPELATVDLIRGAVGGPVSDRDAFTAPDTRVAKSWDVSGRTGRFTLTYDLGRLDGPIYVRLRGSDGRRSQPGFLGASVDPAGPAIDVVGDADPWKDLWFYTNPIWLLPE